MERVQIDAIKFERTQIFHRRFHFRRRRPCLRSLWPIRWTGVTGEELGIRRGLHDTFAPFSPEIRLPHMHLRRWKQVKQCSYDEYSSTWKERVIRKEKCFFPTSPSCRANFSFNCSIAIVRGKIGSTCGWRGGKDFFIISKHFKNFVLCHQVAGFTIMLKDGGKH